MRLTIERVLPYTSGHLVKPENRKRAAADQASEFTTGRLSVYLRCLDHLAASGVRTVSSQSLAGQFRLNAAQIRKDLAWFGEFGVRGVGYSVAGLAAHLRQILGVAEPIHVAVIGAGNLGQALADYPGFPRDGFFPVALFDSASNKVGTASRGGVPIFHVRRLPAVVRREVIRIAMIAVPAAAAQRVAGLAVDAGIRAILNFAPRSVTVPAGVKVKNVDLTISLEGLAFHLANTAHGHTT
jgi:redox-sensing transcriptional repressor